MHISQAAQAVGLSAKQIRDYEKYGLIAPTPRNAAGYRRYDAADLKRLHFICHARAVGFSLAQTSELLRLSDDPHRSSCDVKALTAAHIAMLEDKIRTLEAMRATLQNWHDACAGDAQPECSILRGLTADGCDHPFSGSLK